MKHPSITKKVNYKDMVDELWKKKLSENREEDQLLKKTVVNVSFGVMEKQTNKAQKSKLFDSFEEAKFYDEKFGGTINFINQYKEIETDTGIDSIDRDVDDDHQAMHNLKQVATGNTLFIMSIQAEASMTNGFRFIKELLLQHHNFYLKRSYDMLNENGVKVFSVKTDAFTIMKSQIEQASELLNWQEGIGSWRLNRDSDIIFPTDESILRLRENKLIEIREHIANPIPLTIEDEYNLDKLCSIFETNKQVMIRAEFGGCGKSFACEAMKERGHRVLFVCPTNKLAKKYGSDGITISSLASDSRRRIASNASTILNTM